LRVKKALIPAAGLGTRFLPATKSMPKEMLPIIDTPVIQYVVEEAIDSGIKDIIIITGRGKRAIEDYFDDSPELEMYLTQRNDTELLKLVRDVSSLVDIHYIRQKEPNGLGDAVLRAEKHIGDEPFAEKYGKSIIAVEEVSYEKLSSYGIIKGKFIDDSLYLLEDIIEKPSPMSAFSNIGAVGRYVFTPEIFDCIRSAGTGFKSEIQLTDGIRLLNKSQKIYAYKFKGTRFDIGDRLGYIKAIVNFAIKNENLKENIIEYMKEILEIEKETETKL
jgi:UTP--glucose-1-phosphate uridylyltransferase